MFMIFGGCYENQLPQLHQFIMHPGLHAHTCLITSSLALHILIGILFC